MRVLNNIEPKEVFEQFENISRIPRMSGQEKEVSDYIVKLAKEKGYGVFQDEIGNVVVKIPASSGMEHKAAIVLQSHVDMVCVKSEDSNHDFYKDPISLFINEGFITSKGTTLGADNGIGAAMMLGIMVNNSFSHPLIELLFTVHEEDGMMGIMKFNTNWLKGRTVINLDSEEEGELTAGCAGSGEIDIYHDIKREAVKYSEFLEINMSGLQGGHSGVEIHKERGNAISLLARFLHMNKDICQLVSIKGGTLLNAIPSTAKAIIATNSVDDIKKKIDKYMKMAIDENVEVSGIKMTAKKCEPLTSAFTKKCFENLLLGLLLIPTGPLSRNLEVGVTFSNNLAILSEKDDKVIIKNMCRCEVISQVEGFEIQLEYIAKAMGATMNSMGAKPGWKYKEVSPIRDVVVNTYKRLTGKEIIVGVIHAGLECGVIDARIENIDAVSFGPDIFNAHTPFEKVSIDSVKRTYHLLLEILSSL